MMTTPMDSASESPMHSLPAESEEKANASVTPTSEKQPPLSSAPPAIEQLMERLLDGLPEEEFYHIGDVLALEPAYQRALFDRDPGRFILSFLDTFGSMIRRHSTLLEAIHAHRVLDSDMEPFMPMVLQTLKQMELQGELDNTLTWAEAIQKAKEQVQAQLKQLVAKEGGMTSTASLNSTDKGLTPVKVGAGQRSGSGDTPHFTAKQIQAMSVDEFSKHKDAIFKAYKDGRIG